MAVEKIVYQEAQLPPADPMQVLENFVAAGSAQEYWVYGDDQTVAIALDGLAEVAVGDERLYVFKEFDTIGENSTSELTDPLAQIGRALDQLPIENWRAYGHLSFDLAGDYGNYPLQARSPRARFVVPATEILFRPTGTTLRTIHGLASTTKLIQQPWEHLHASPNVSPFDRSDQDSYEAMVVAALDVIDSGELEKVILASTVDVPGELDVLSTLYSVLANTTAARKFGFSQRDLAGVGASPETLMTTAPGGVITSNPLAGTRPRGLTPEQDRQLLRELKTDPKEIREHIISVLAVRMEELQRVCKLGSLCIKDLLQVVQYDSVQHLSSRVEGRLAYAYSLWDALKALFPGVTATGAGTKERAIELIAQLEQRARGPYAGAVGWVDSKGNADLALALRAAFQDADGLTVTSGAGIIRESLPFREYEETRAKKRAIQPHLVVRAA